MLKAFYLLDMRRKKMMMMAMMKIMIPQVLMTAPLIFFPLSIMVALPMHYS